MTKEMPLSSLATAGVESWTYREMGLVPIPASEETAGREVVPPASSPGVSEAEVADRVHHAVVEAQQRWAAEAQQRATGGDARVFLDPTLPLLPPGGK